MALVLCISSQVAASRVGTSAGAFVLRRLGHEVMVIPTVLLGRHPGWGAPGGGAIATDHLRSMWNAIAAQGLSFDAVQTGYFANTDQISLAAEIIDTLSPGTILVDPVIGDHGSLYVAPEIAAAIRDTLIPRAHIITPNIWEHEWLSAQDPLPANLTELITSHVAGTDPSRIGALYKDAKMTLSVSHERFTDVPHGGGDTLAALWLAHHLNGIDPKTNLERSVGSVLGLLRAARNTDAGELMLAREQSHFLHPDPLEATHV